MTCHINFKTMLTIAMIIGVAFAAPRPDKSDLNNEIIPSGGFATKNGESVSASWGGFQASASLADDGSAVASAGGNGLGASSGYGAGGAGAGASVGGIGAASEAGSAAGGYGNGGKPSGASGSVQSHQGGAGAGTGFFDKIFAIPINVLQSVNTYLNQKQQVQGQQGATHGHHNNNSGVPAAASATASSGANKASESHAGADNESVGKPGSPMMVQTKTNYDDIFNIPITALRSVQNLLNG